MKREELINLTFALLFFVVVGVVGFAWMYVLLGILFVPLTTTHLIVSAILGPFLLIGWIVLVTWKGNTTLIEMAVSGSLPIGPVALLAALHYWTSLSLAWSIPIALIVGLPAGLLIGLCVVVVFGGLGYTVWKIACFFVPSLTPVPTPPIPGSEIDLNDVSWLIRRPDDPAWECHMEDCHKPVVKFTRLCREHLKESAQEVSVDSDS